MTNNYAYLLENFYENNQIGPRMRTLK